MERILSNEQMRLADKFTINTLGISEQELINRAGSALANEIKKRFAGGRVLVCVGKGNNGNDGRLLAQILSKTHGFSVATLNIYNGIFKLLDKKFDIIVDCIFGTGLDRNVEGKYKDAIEKINNSGAFIISCDIPSGINGDSGLVMGCAIKANLTIAIQEYKLGHFLNDGPDYCGQLACVDIGISIWGDEFAYRLTKQDVSNLFAKRIRNTHKGNFGKACVLGGSSCFPGSVLLSANAISALKMGIGYCNIAVADSLMQFYVHKTPECTFTPLKSLDGKLLYDEFGLTNLLNFDSIAIGMGLTCSENVYNSIKFLLKNYKGTLIIDADGLNSLSKFGLDVLLNKSCKVVLTPHVGEFSRLSGLTKEEIINNFIQASKDFAKKYNVVLLLKSATSVITDGEMVCLNTTGTSCLSKGGSGDILSGIIAGITARNNELFSDVASSAFLLGIAGEICSKKFNDYSTTPSEVIGCIHNAIDFLAD